MSNAAREICKCGHSEAVHSTLRIAGRRPCYSLGCPCTLYLRTLTTEHVDTYSKGVGAVLDALKKGDPK